MKVYPLLSILFLVACSESATELPYNGNSANGDTIAVDTVAYKDGVFPASPKFGQLNGNPISDFVYCADPTAIEYEGRLYVYATNDHQQYEKVGLKWMNSYEHINSFQVFSTEDLVNWTYHGIIDMSKICMWKSSDAVAWAPSVVSRKEEDGKTHFYMYYSNGGNSVGVITATSPLGPWTDPIGRVLIEEHTTGLSECPNPFDPGAVIDDNGDAWLSFGGGTASTGNSYMPGTARIVKLGKDMLSFASEFKEIPAPYFLEASELNYINGLWVYSYCNSWDDRTTWNISGVSKPSGCSISYTTTKSPLNANSWQYCGTYLCNPGDAGLWWGNNHSHIQKYNGNYYLLYHARTLEENRDYEGGYRSVHIAPINIDEATGSISPVNPSLTGADPLKLLSPHSWVSAATVSATQGVSFVEGDEIGEMLLKADSKGQTTEVRNVDCTSSPTSINCYVKGKGRMDIRLDNAETGKLLAAVAFDTNSEWKSVTSKVKDLKGVHTLYFTVHNGDFLFKKWQMK